MRIGYLGELDARQLITDPMEQFPLAYDEAAIDRIAAVTRAHPYLAQSVCHNEAPPLVQLNAAHTSLCHFAEKLYAG